MSSCDVCVAPTMLGTKHHAFSVWYDCFKRAYGREEVKFKYHQAMHLGRQFKLQHEQHASEHEVKTPKLLWPTCFVLERKHKGYKRYALHSDRQVKFEKGVTLQLINDEFRLNLQSTKSSKNRFRIDFRTDTFFDQPRWRGDHWDRPFDSVRA